MGAMAAREAIDNESPEGFLVAVLPRELPEAGLGLGKEGLRLRDGHLVRPRWEGRGNKTKTRGAAVKID
jgi:hypothetical protein